MTLDPSSEPRGRRTILWSRVPSLALVWGGALVVVGALYWFLAGVLSQPDLFTTPALLVVAGAAYASWRVARPRHRAVRLRGDRRRAMRRDEDDAAPSA